MDGHRVAEFAVRDPLRPDAHEALLSLKSLGIQLSVVSGDNEQSVAAVAESLGICDFRSNCTPKEKLEIIEHLQSRGECVVMVGDGINDAPVLAGADTSIAPAHGALLAQTNADVIMLGESLQPVVTALKMSRKALHIVRQNLVWAVVYNATALPLAVAGLVPPWLAAIGMSASSLVVVLNALRLNRFE
jgi:Cu2+-exporting ATPase